MQPYMGHMGGGYYLIGQGYGLYQNQPYVNQPFHGPWNQMSQTNHPFLATLNPPNPSKLTNDRVCHDPMSSIVLKKIP